MSISYDTVCLMNFGSIRRTFHQFSDFLYFVFDNFLWTLTPYKSYFFLDAHLTCLFNISYEVILLLKVNFEKDKKFHLGDSQLRKVLEFATSPKCKYFKRNTVLSKTLAKPGYSHAVVMLVHVYDIDCVLSDQR